MLRLLLPGALALSTFWLAACGDDIATEPPASPEPTTSAPDLAVTSNSWITRATLTVTRSGHAVATVTNAAGQSIVYVIGGRTAGFWPNAKVAAYNVATNRWTWPRPLPVALAGSNGAGVINGKIYVSGGHSYPAGDGYIPSRVLYMYDPAVNTWTRKRDIPLVTINGEERIGGGKGVTGVINGRLYVVAGCFTLPSEWWEYVESCNPLFFRYNPVTNGWSRLRSPFGSDPPTTSPFGGGVIGGKFYLIAKSFTGDARFSVYDPATNRWTTKPILGSAYWGVATAVLGGKLYVMGGSRTNYDAGYVETLDLTRVFNPMTNVWSQRARLPSPRAGIAGTTVMLNGSPRIEVIGGPAPGNNLQYIP